MEDGKKQMQDMMENLDTPSVNIDRYRNEFRLTLLNTRKSAVAGLLLLIIPFLFISGVLLKHYLHIDFGVLTSVYEWIAEADRKFGDRSALNWLLRALLILGPLAAIALNLAAVLHIRYERAAGEILVAAKLKWLNWSIIVICSLVFAVFFFYLLIENA